MTSMYKASNREDRRRPISVLATTARTVEKLLHPQLHDHFVEN